MKKLNLLQSIENHQVFILYSEKSGYLNICSKHSFISNDELFKVAITHANIADSFVRWCSIANKLPNQADKPWDNVGCKPTSTKIFGDWLVFREIYKSIIL